MKTTAMVLKEYGDNVKFTKSEIELPPLKPNQLLIEVNATSINPVDNMIMHGVPLGPELPSPIHGDVSGVVIGAGDKVKNFSVGDQIFGIAGGLTGYSGASSNHMIVNEDLVFHKPKTLTFSEAAALPLVFVTAYEGLVSKARIQKGEKLLVIGGTGGVGHQVVQLGALLGAKVTAVVSSSKQADIAKAFGASHTINRKEIDLESYCEHAGVPDGFDIVFDTVGGANLETCWDLTRPNGQVITTKSTESHDLTPIHMKGLSLHIIFMLLPMLTHKDQKRHQNILKYLAEKVDEGKIKPLITSQRFDLSNINEAHSAYESGNYLGKIVIENSKKLTSANLQ